jgi:tetratricopeptide (TPR) repeat protein
VTRVALSIDAGATEGSVALTLGARSVGSMREEGNDHYRANRIFRAIELYTECILMEPSAPLHCNRAVAFMALDKDEKIRERPEAERLLWRQEGMKNALLDASRGAMKYDGQFPKAFFLTGACRLELAKADTESTRKERYVQFELAVEALTRAQELAPRDKAVERRLEEGMEAMMRIYVPSEDDAPADASEACATASEVRGAGEGSAAGADAAAAAGAPVQSVEPRARDGSADAPSEGPVVAWEEEDGVLV